MGYRLEGEILDMPKNADDTGLTTESGRELQILDNRSMKKAHFIE